MHHHINHCWCSMSNWDNKTFCSTNMVSIEADDVDVVDFERLIDEILIVLEEEKQHLRKFSTKHPENSFTEEELTRFATTTCYTLKPEVIQWLNDNIKPQTSGEPGWAMGNDEYRARDIMSLTLWFIRRNDAKKFIRTFSMYKKATSYFNYFDSPITNLVLDLKTKKYKNRHDTEEEIDVVIQSN